VLVASGDEFMEYKEVKTYGTIGELIFTPNGDESRWYIVGLYNLADSDLDILDYESATFHAGYLLRRNIRLISEFTYRFETNTTEPTWRTSLGFVSAF
jgi:hypothetical protein